MRILTATTPRMIYRDFGSCIRLGNNTTDAVALTQNIGLPISQSAAFTLAWWNYIDDLSNGVYLFSEGKLSTTVPVFGLHCAGSKSGKIGLFTKNDANGGSDIAGGVNILVPRVWQFLSVTCNAGTIKVYLNGVYTGQSYTRTAGATTLDRTTWGALGRSVYAGSCNGKQDNMMIFSRILSDPEILNLGYTGKFDPTNLLSYLKCDENTGTTLADASGNGNIGTLIGGAWSSSVVMKARVAASGRVPALGRLSS